MHLRQLVRDLLLFLLEELEERVPALDGRLPALSLGESPQIRSPVDNGGLHVHGLATSLGQTCPVAERQLHAGEVAQNVQVSLVDLRGLHVRRLGFLELPVIAHKKLDG